MAYGTASGNRADEYWATLADGDEVAEAVLCRIETFREELERDALTHRRRRSAAYYYNNYYPRGMSGRRELASLGDRGQFVGLAANHLRSLVQNVHTLVTQSRIVWDTRAVNSELKSLQQARMGNNVLEYYMIQGKAERHLKEACEHALVLGVGFIFAEWSWDKGRAIAQDPETGIDLREGDLVFSNPTIEDVGWDVSAQSWEDDVKWYFVRQKKHRWDLAARFPDKRDEILGISSEDMEDRLYDLRWDRPETEDTDLIDVIKFFHLPCDACPTGRYMLLLPDGTVLIDADNPYPENGLLRMSAGEVMGSCLGWTMAYDLQGLQEALNGELSTIATNHKSYGVQNVWAKGGKLFAQPLAGGLQVLESDEEPKPINLTFTPGEIFEFARDIQRHMEYLSGVNSVARGQPEKNLESGAALALIDSKALQLQSHLAFSYQGLAESLGTFILKTLRRFADNERVIAIQGKHNRAYQHYFTGDDLDRVDRVFVLTGNPLAKTVSGRVQMAQDLIAQGMIRTPEEYVNVLETGNLDTLLEGERAQLDLVRSENEDLMDAKLVAASVFDYHLLHLQEHQALLNSPEIRFNEQLTLMVVSHIMEHVQMLQAPMVLEFQMALGFRIPPSPMMGMPMGDEGEAGSIGPNNPGGMRNEPKQLQAPMPEGYAGAPGVQGPSMPKMPKPKGAQQNAA